jgi:hypothetical protein
MSITMPKRYVKIEVTDEDGTVKTFLNQNSVGPRVDFYVIRKTQTFGNGFSTAEIKIYNLKDETFKFLRNKGKEISLKCGHENVNGATINQVFNGFVYSVLRNKVGPDIITILYCSTVHPNNPKFKLLFSRTYARIPLTDLLKSLANDMGVTLALNCNFSGVNIVNRSYCKEAKLVLDELATTYEFIWEVRGNNLYINKIDDVNNNNVKIFEFSHASGLLKPPVVTEKGVDIYVFLQPNINPMDKFFLNAEFATFNLGALQFQDRISSKINVGTIRVSEDGNRYVGRYTVLFLVDEGSTHTETWQTRIEGIAEGQV